MTAHIDIDGVPLALGLEVQVLTIPDEVLERDYLRPLDRTFLRRCVGTCGTVEGFEDDGRTYVLLVDREDDMPHTIPIPDRQLRVDGIDRPPVHFRIPDPAGIGPDRWIRLERGRPIDVSVVREFERDFEVVLPELFVAMACAADGAHFVGRPVVFPDATMAGRTDSAECGLLENFLRTSLAGDDMLGLNEPWEDLPVGVVLFGHEGGGRTFCLDYRIRGPAGKPIVGIHDTGGFEGEDPVARIADGFREFAYEVGLHGPDEDPEAECIP